MDVGFLGSVGPSVVAFDDTDLKSYWKFEASSTPVTNDSESAVDLGTAADLDMTGATFNSGGGIIGSSWTFDGVNDFGIAGSSLSQYNFMHNNAYLFTVNLWYKKATAASNLNQGPWGSGGGDPTAIGFVFWIDDRTANKKWHFSIINSGGSRVMRLDAGSVPQDTNWHMLSVRANNATPRCAVALDGNTGGEVADTTEEAAPSDADATGAFKVGERITSDDLDFDGDHDEFAIFNRSISDDEVSEINNDDAGLEIY